VREKPVGRPWKKRTTLLLEIRVRWAGKMFHNEEVRKREFRKGARKGGIGVIGLEKSTA